MLAGAPRNFLHDRGLAAMAINAPDTQRGLLTRGWEVIELPSPVGAGSIMHGWRVTSSPSAIAAAATV
jgi:hypothetical protein